MAMPGGAAPIRKRDRVQLPSGGPVMTVERIFDYVRAPYAQCVWFDAKSEFQRVHVDLDALEPAPEKEAP